MDHQARSLVLVLVSALFVLVSCASPPQRAPGSPSAEAPTAGAADPSETTPGPASEPRPDGAACTQGDECASGICEGEGCGVDEGRCAPRLRGCTKDLQAYCGCDGQTFQASGTCPGSTYRHRGACEEEPRAVQ